MPHINPLPRDTLEALEPVFASAEANMGFVPNSMLTMAHMPQLPMAFAMLAGVVMGADLTPQLRHFRQNVPADSRADEALSPDLVQLIAYCVSLSAGCGYCQAHTSHSGHSRGLDENKIKQILIYESSDEFSDAEKALIGLALAAGEVPNGSSGEHFEALREHFSERQIVQIVGVISLFGFLNRWNDTVATQLESAPSEFAHGVLEASGWALGKHAG